jgi:rhamnulose-1-phosphate aldolase
VLVDGEAAGYFVLWSAREEFAVTSEFVSHAEVHADLLARGTGQRAVLHTHATELIALSHVPGYDDEARLTDVLWRTMPEVRVFLPWGVAVVPETLPGSKALADLTVAALRRRDVVLWARHGVLAAGADLEDAFDLIDLANKGADITLRCLAAGQPPVGLSDASLRDLEREFRLR